MNLEKHGWGGVLHGSVERLIGFVISLADQQNIIAGGRLPRSDQTRVLSNRLVRIQRGNRHHGPATGHQESDSGDPKNELFHKFRVPPLWNSDIGGGELHLASKKFNGGETDGPGLSSRAHIARRQTSGRSRWLAVRWARAHDP